MIADLLAHQASTQPTAPAFRQAGTSLTWAALDDQVARRAGAFRDLGIGAGDRLALVLPPGLDAVVATLAGIRLGASLVPLWWRAPATELAAQVDAAGVTVLVASAPAKANVLLATEQSISPPPLWSTDSSIRSLDELGGEPAGPRPQDPEAEICVIFTSGSTGVPKGVRLTLANHLASTAGCQESLGGVGPDDRWLVPLGLHRIGGFAVLLRALVTGLSVELFERYDAGSVLAAAGDAPGAIISAVPTMVRDLVDRDRGNVLRSARAILLGGAPATTAEVGTWADAGLAVCPTYGMSETCSQIATVAPGRAARDLGTVGRPHSGVRVRVTGDGEILLGGPVVSPGYLDESMTASRFGTEHGERWYATGDLGHLDDDNRLVVTGRADLLIITGGEKVQPERVEEVMTSHPGVQAAVVFGVADPHYGEVVSARVVGNVDPDTLVTWCRERLPRYMVPRHIDVVDALPRTEDGKLLRR